MGKFTDGTEVPPAMEALRREVVDALGFEVEVYNGGCPECGKQDRILNIGRDHWGVCVSHKNKWPLCREAICSPPGVTKTSKSGASIGRCCEITFASNLCPNRPDLVPR